MEKVDETNLKRMEELLNHSASGIHILFDNKSLAKVLAHPADHTQFLNGETIKKVQDLLINLIAKKSYVEKMAFLQDLDSESYEMVVRTYFHILENTIRSNPNHVH